MKLSADLNVLKHSTLNVNKSSVINHMEMIIAKYYRIGYIPAGLINNPLIPVVQQPAAVNHRSHNIIMVIVTLHEKHHNGAVH